MYDKAWELRWESCRPAASGSTVPTEERVQGGERFVGGLTGVNSGDDRAGMEGFTFEGNVKEKHPTTDEPTNSPKTPIDQMAISKEPAPPNRG